MDLSLVTDDETLRDAIRGCCPPPHHIGMYSWKGFLTSEHTVSEQGLAMLQYLRASDAVLVKWDMNIAPMFNLLCYQVRRGAAHRKTFAPVLAICDTLQDEISALAAGADDAVVLPLILPVLQARIAAHHRIAEAVRRATAHRIQHHIERTKEAAHEVLGERVEHAPREKKKRRKDDKPISSDVGEIHAGDLAAQSSNNVISSVEKAVQEELTLIDPDHDVVALGPLRLDRTAYRFFVGDKEIELMPKEFALLNYMIEHADEACTRDQILDEVWGIDFDTGTNMVDVYMHFLRKKLEANGLEDMLQTIRGRGYRMTVAPFEDKQA